MKKNAKKQPMNIHAQKRKHHTYILSGFIAICVCGLLFLAISLIYAYQQPTITPCSKSDKCCIESLEYVYETQQILSIDGACPAQTRVKQFNCATSVHWCEPNTN
jgi:hypothetical protein